MNSGQGFTRREFVQVWMAAALAGVAGALWLRQRQWASDTSSSSSVESGSPRVVQADDNGDVRGEDADGALEEGWVQSGEAVRDQLHATKLPIRLYAHDCSQAARPLYTAVHVIGPS